MSIFLPPAFSYQEIDKESLAQFCADVMEVARDDPEFKEQAMICASIFVGQDEKRLSELSGLPIERVFRLSKRLIEQQIWDGKGGWNEKLKQEDALSLVMVFMVAKGHLKYHASQGAFQDDDAFSLTEEGLRKAEELICEKPAARAFLRKFSKTKVKSKRRAIP